MDILRATPLVLLLLLSLFFFRVIFYVCQNILDLQTAEKCQYPSTLYKICKLIDIIILNHTLDTKKPEATEPNNNNTLMYCYTTQTQNNLQALALKRQPLPPLLTIRCKCQRQFLQQQIYTCLSCSGYACRYCTAIELHTYYCRNCSEIVSDSECTKLFRCQKCFSCPSCQHVLSVVKDPKTNKIRKQILLCQFCYWSSKEIGIAEEKTEDLLKIMDRHSKGIKDSELKAYMSAQRYFKERHLEAEKIRDFNKKRNSSAIIDLRMLQPSPVVIQQQPLKTSGLDEQALEEDRRDRQVPKGLPLLSRKTRRCLDCKKLLTKSFKTFRNEHKVELGHSEPKVLMCQKNLATEKISLKCLVDALMIKGDLSRQYRNGDIIEVPAKDTPYEFELIVEFTAPNKEKKSIKYKFVLQN